MSKRGWIVITIFSIIVISIGVLFKMALFPSKETVSTSSAYQAVFLSNAQVYFGKITGMNGDFITMTDIYYLQANQSIQGSSADSQPFTLVKLGKELHGPTDVMHINRSQVLFYEDLRSDSSVVKSIMSYKADHAGQ